MAAISLYMIQSDMGWDLLYIADLIKHEHKKVLVTSISSSGLSKKVKKRN